MLSGHHRPDQGILGRPVATDAADMWALPLNYPLLLQNLSEMPGCRCSTAVCLLSILSPHSCRLCLPSRACMQMQPFPSVSLLLANGHESQLSFLLPPCFDCGLLYKAAILTGLPLQLVLCEACCFPLASADGRNSTSPGALVPSYGSAVCDRRASIT